MDYATKQDNHMFRKKQPKDKIHNKKNNIIAKSVYKMKNNIIT